MRDQDCRKQLERSREGSKGLKHFPLAGGLEDGYQVVYRERRALWLVGGSTLANRMPRHSAEVLETFVRIQGYHHLRNCPGGGGENEYHDCVGESSAILKRTG